MARFILFNRRYDVIAHTDGFCAGSFLVILAVVTGFLPCTHDAAGGVYDSTETVVVKRIGDVLCGCALRAVARHEEVGLRQQLTDDLLLLGIGCADYGTDLVVAARRIQTISAMRA